MVVKNRRNAGSGKQAGSTYPGWMVPEAHWSSHRDFLLGDPTGLEETEDLAGETQPLEAVVRMPGGRGRTVTMAIGLGLGWVDRPQVMGTYFPYRQSQCVTQRDEPGAPWGSGVQLMDGW